MSVAGQQHSRHTVNIRNGFLNFLLGSVIDRTALIATDLLYLLQAKTQTHKHSDVDADASLSKQKASFVFVRTKLTGWTVN